ncbi:hypothetical protein ACN2EN_05635 [Aliarcobacter lanthieri]|uniref:hypothetical protein n=1 Tax=Aliarcobacter lanthieri TaxID=1355374 RepID=UPI003AFA7961
MIEELIIKLKENVTCKQDAWKKDVYNSQHYQEELKLIRDITSDFIHTLNSISLYSTRVGKIYDDFLTIKAIDDILQSVIAILSLVENGIHNTIKRELRYLIEMMTKYVIVDYIKMGEKITIKTQYLKDSIPNSSIDIIDQYTPLLSVEKNDDFKTEVKDFFYKACAYVHPSKKQIDEQVKNYERGNTIGFESSKMLADMNKLIFRAYDMILVMLFHGFGDSMSGDLFIQLLDDNKKWKFHKSKYVKEYSKNFDYKHERNT